MAWYTKKVGKPDYLPCLQGHVIKDVLYAWCPICGQYHKHSSKGHSFVFRGTTYWQRTPHCPAGYFRDRGIYFIMETRHLRPIEVKTEEEDA